MSHGLKLEGVDFSYDASQILAGIDLSIPVGQFVTLLGASGSGKSTLLRLVAGLQFPQQGKLAWAGKPIAGPGLDRGVVFQDYALFPWLSVVDNIAIAIGKAHPETRKAERRAEAAEYLKKVGLEAAIGKYPFELSGGMRQRAESSPTSTSISRATGIAARCSTATPSMNCANPSPKRWPPTPCAS